jgi:hypothetical protein
MEHSDTMKDTEARESVASSGQCPGNNSRNATVGPSSRVLGTAWQKGWSK